jgi:CheY-like chemotaxis protein
LFITGYVENAALDKGAFGAGTHLLTKPFSVDDLARHLQSLVMR